MIARFVSWQSIVWLLPAIVLLVQFTNKPFPFLFIVYLSFIILIIILNCAFVVAIIFIALYQMLYRMRCALSSVPLNDAELRFFSRFTFYARLIRFDSVSHTHCFCLFSFNHSIIHFFFLFVFFLKKKHKFKLTF